MKCVKMCVWEKEPFWGDQQGMIPRGDCAVILGHGNIAQGEDVPKAVTKSAGESGSLGEGARAVFSLASPRYCGRKCILFDCFFTTFGSQVRHLYICDFHKNFIQSVRNKRKRKTSDDGGDSPEHDTDVPEVDLFQLQVNTLRRYKRHYKLQTRPGLNKAQLAETVSRHFRNIPVNEKETLAYFIYMVKNNKSRLDQKSEGSKQLD
uniref:SAP30 like n=1 Tax=Zonotrichia albicollis TaxID=44394 RepID=A0A8D2MWA1_ZONAL